VSRERLRTWERRYDFPHPQRSGRGPRRYLVADAGAVVAVRRAAEQGVPLPGAIEAVRAASGASQVSPAAFAAISERLPAPLMLLSGPSPTRIEYVNPALSNVPGSEALRPGAEIAEAVEWFPGSALDEAVSALLRTDESARECAHPPWTDPTGQPARSLMFGLSVEPGALAMVALIQLERPPEREAKRAMAELREDHRRVDVRLERHERWLAAIAELAELFQRETGPALMQATADTLVRRLPAIDAGIAVYMGGELALGSSSRGMLGPRMVTVTAHADLSAVLREGAPAWLTSTSAAAFGAPAVVHVLAVPVSVVGETLGGLLLVAEEQTEIDEPIRQLLSVLSATIGFALLRDRLMEGARRAGP
jgi:DNA-binding transcriptional MerR regulator